MIIISIKSTEVFSRVCNLQLLPTVNMPKRDLVREKNNFSKKREREGSGKMGNHKVPFMCAFNKPKTACFIIASIKSNEKITNASEFFPFDDFSLPCFMSFNNFGRKVLKFI